MTIRNSPRLGLLVLLIGAGLVGCGEAAEGESVAQTSAEIRGGFAVGAADAISRSVVMLRIGSGVCSGTLVAENAVLTAAHCFDGVSVVNLANVTFRLPDGSTAERNGTWAIHPQWTSANPIDLAVVTFTGGLPASARPLPLAAPSSFTPPRLVMSGYGCANSVETNCGLGVLRQVNIGKAGEASGLVYAYDEGRSLGGGDSGGATMWRHSGRYVLGAVNTAVATTTSGQVVSIATDVRPNIDWIRQRVSSAEAQLTSHELAGGNTFRRYESDSPSLYHRIGRANGDGWEADTARDRPDFLSYGPYHSDVPQGSNVAAFRLMVDNNSAENNAVVTVDAFDVSAGRVVARRVIHRSEFRRTFRYQEFSLPFVSEANRVMEFRVYWHGSSYVKFDAVTIHREEPRDLRYAANGPSLFHQVGRAEGDGWAANTAQHAEGFLVYGPYTPLVPEGANRATFQLMVDNNVADDVVVARIDAVSGGGAQVLASRILRRRDFNSDGMYHDFDLNYIAPAGGNVEFRTYFTRTSYIRQRDVRSSRASVAFVP